MTLTSRMNPGTRRAIVLSLIDALSAKGSWTGQTHIQKSVFFLQEALGVRTDLEFVLYKHGPYSFELRDELSENAGRLLLEATHHQPYGPSFSLTQSGRRYLVTHRGNISKYRKAIDRTADSLAHMGVSELERIATALYVTHELPLHTDERQRAQRLTSLKPHIPMAQALSAIRKLDEILPPAEPKR